MPEYISRVNNSLASLLVDAACKPAGVLREDVGWGLFDAEHALGITIGDSAGRVPFPCTLAEVVLLMKKVKTGDV